MIVVEITNTNYVVNSSAVSYPVSVTADNNLFTVTNTVQTFSVTNVSSIVTFNTDGGGGFDFVSRNMGDWVAYREYIRNDIVRYDYSLYICSIDPIGNYSSATPPPNDLAHWELFINNEWPKHDLTITDTLVVHNVVADNITLNNAATFNTLTVDDLQTNGFRIGNLRYPRSTGLYGQVLTTNGVNTATWVNLGDLVYWSLSNDLLTNGFNISTGIREDGVYPQLTIGSGNTNAGYHSSIQFAATGPTQGRGYIFVKGNMVLDGTMSSTSTISATTLSANTVNAGTVNVSNRLSVTGNEADFTHSISAYGGITLFNDSAIQGDEGPVKIYPGIRFPDGTVQTTAGGGGSTSTYVLPIASGSTLGGIKVGSNLTINPVTGVLDANTATTFNLNTASATQLGGVKVGINLTVRPDGTLDANTASTYVLTTASTTRLGGIKVGNNLYMDGEFLNANTSTYTLPAATTATLGGVKVGTGLQVEPDGTINFVGTVTTAGIVSLTEDMYLNNHRIYNDTYPHRFIELSSGNTLIKYGPDHHVKLGFDGYHEFVEIKNIDLSSLTLLGYKATLSNPNAKVEVNTNNVTIAAPSSQLYVSSATTVLSNQNINVTLNATSATIATTATSVVLNDQYAYLNAPRTRVGSTIYESRLFVSKIYNYDGTYAPFFPAGIQFNDQTVQRTAYEPDGGLIP